jgi:hypothetical protein
VASALVGRLARGSTLFSQARPEAWFLTAETCELVEPLREAIDWERLTGAGMVQMLDEFEATRDSEMASRH